ncbi:class C beta-lactamase [Pseudomonas mucidolens]|uniref:Beta-lactamase n=1 Tax=Pseudomonas mucidolens TaxID=46679 RepID=A0A1H2MJL3_9PSED|nr:class C beta-lactamase [Pseudomonas mucidolens]SDU93215.1 beta-lactamase class C [Pseudomonas mucidolens]SQH33765.1 beta-lactamase [Pseudomonas mucidolens]
MYTQVRNTTIFALLLGAGNCMAATDIRTVVDATVLPLMHQQAIPGLSVAIVQHGKAQYFNYGVASKDTQKPVTENTLFEIGSVSKTFTATLAGYAQASGKLNLSAPASQYLLALGGGPFDNISVLNLGTYSAGGLPLQFPNDADNSSKMISYFQHWKPEFEPGAQRLYSNPSLGLFGYLAAQSLKQPFNVAMENTLLPKLGLKHTFVDVPKAQMGLYAQGYDKRDMPVRVGPGALSSEAYGVKSSPADLIHYVAMNINPASLEKPLQQAIAATHTGYYRVDNTLQGLGWEMYAYPTKLDDLLAGNSTSMAMEPHKANWLTPPQPLRAGTLVNKTGSTNGFGAYIAYVPSKAIGIVILANKNYPNAERVKAAHAILSAMDH